MKYLLSAILLWSVSTSCKLQAKSVVKSRISPKTTLKAKNGGVPHEINYQGWLGNESDTTGITNDLDMIFRLYADSTGGTPIWTENQDDVPVNKGIFNVLLGSLPSNIFTGDPLWLETQVEDDTLSPRKKLVSVGYAIKSEEADHAIHSDTADYALAADVNIDSVAYADTAGYVAGADVDGEVAKANKSDTADYALSASVGVVDSANVTANAWNWNNNLWGTEYPKANASDTANYVAGINVDGEVAQANKSDTAAYALSADVGYVDSANVTANAWNWNNNLWGTEYPKANISDTANYSVTTDTAGYVAGANVDGEVAEASHSVYADTAGYATASGGVADTANYAHDSDRIDGLHADAFADTGHTHSHVDSATYADTANYALSASNDNDWTISGNDMYSAVSGNVGIGTPSPDAKLTVKAGADGRVLRGYNQADQVIVEIGEGLDYAETFPMSQAKIGSGMVVVIDPVNRGSLTLSTQPYDTKVAGIVSGANGLGSGIRLGKSSEEGGQAVALSGRVYCNVDAQYGDIKPGDLLTTSPTPGHAMVVKDFSKARGAILGKAMEGLSEGKKGQILVLVTLQ